MFCQEWVFLCKKSQTSLSEMLQIRQIGHLLKPTYYTRKGASLNNIACNYMYIILINKTNRREKQE